VLARANQGFLSVPLFAEEPYFLNDDAYDALGVPELRRHAVLHDIPTRTATDVRKATLLARLKVSLLRAPSSRSPRVYCLF